MRWPLRLALAAHAFAMPAAHASPRVVVRGVTHVEASATRDAHGVEVRGRVLDDAGTPVPEARLRLPPPSSDTVWVRRSCSLAHADSDLPERIQADLRGEFCVRFVPKAWGPANLTVTVAALPSPLHDAAPAVAVAVGAEARTGGMTLELVSGPRTVPLEAAKHTYWLMLEAPLGQSNTGLTVHAELESEGRRTPLDHAAVPATGRVRIDVASAALGAPGPAALVFSVRSAAADVLAETRVFIDRMTRVELGAPRVNVTSEGVDLSVPVRSGAGAPVSGSIELRRGGDWLGGARVEGGSARLRVPLSGDGAPLELAFVADRPGFIAPPPISVTLPAGSPVPWRRWPYLALALLLVGGLAGTWRRPLRVRRRADTSPAPPPSGRAELTVFERGPERGGWHGRVSDAHDGTAVAGARVHIVTASFTPSTEHVAITDTDGRFELPTLNAAREGARLEVSAPWHSTLVCPLPAPGRLGVAVVLRKRALLDRLIAWAKRHEVPPREPTPRQLAEWAERRGFGAAHSWAERVEQAAYGPAPVDEGREEALRAEEPSLAPTSSAETRPLDRNR